VHANFYGQDEYLMLKTTSTPDVMEDDDHYAATLQVLLPKTRRWQGTTAAGCMD
jgi:hypothetical protein